MLSKEEILENLKKVKDNISKNCKKVGRENDVTLVAVTKTFPNELIQTCINLDVNIVGENRARELRDKYKVFKDEVSWHMIGHMQRNKVKYVIDKVDLIHSLDSKRLAKEINKRAKKNDVVMDCLLQINIVDEDSKYGILKKDIDNVFEYVQKFENIRIVGLMNMAPFYDNPENARSDFRKMKELFDSYKNNNYENVYMKHLSMGMTNDYHIAVQEGSNMVRIGSAIFGKRDYS